MKFVVKKPEALFYGMCEAHVDIFNRLGVAQGCNRQTDRHSLSKCCASLHCIADNLSVTRRNSNNT